MASSGPREPVMKMVAMPEKRRQQIGEAPAAALDDKADQREKAEQHGGVREADDAEQAIAAPAEAEGKGNEHGDDKAEQRAEEREARDMARGIFIAQARQRRKEPGKQHQHAEIEGQQRVLRALRGDDETGGEDDEDCRQRAHRGLAPGGAQRAVGGGRQQQDEADKDEDIGGEQAADTAQGQRQQQGGAAAPQGGKFRKSGHQLKSPLVKISVKMASGSSATWAGGGVARADFQFVLIALKCQYSASSGMDLAKGGRPSIQCQ